MGTGKRNPGFWATVVYEVDLTGPFPGWIARRPGLDIAGCGWTKREALAELKSARLRAKLVEERLRP